MGERDPKALIAQLRKLGAEYARLAPAWGPEHAADAETLNAAADALQSATARAERVEKALQWVREVYPGTTRDPSRGAVVEMTWDEFNEMREAIGLKPVQPHARRQRPKQATPLSDGGADG